MEIKLRPAKQADAFLLWRWRNHPLMRKWSFCKDKIAYQQHKEWLNKKLEDENTLIYMAVNGKGSRIGQARFEIKNGNQAVISVNLNPRFIGKGLGRQLIAKATREFLRENRNTKRVLSKVIAGNIASENAFQKAGYKFLKDGYKKGTKEKVFCYRRDIR